MTKRRKYTVTLRLTHPEMVKVKGLQAVMQEPTVQGMMLRLTDAMTQAIMMRNSMYAEGSPATSATVGEANAEPAADAGVTS